MKYARLKKGLALLLLLSSCAVHTSAQVAFTKAEGAEARAAAAAFAER